MEKNKKLKQNQYTTSENSYSTGAALYEFLWILPVLLIIFVGLGELGRLLSVGIEVSNTTYSNVLVAAKTSPSLALAAIQDRRAKLAQAMQEKKSLELLVEDGPPSYHFDAATQTVSLKVNSKVNPLFANTTFGRDIAVEFTAPLLDASLTAQPLNNNGFQNGGPCSDSEPAYDCDASCTASPPASCLYGGSGGVPPPGPGGPPGVSSNCDTLTRFEATGPSGEPGYGAAVVRASAKARAVNASDTGEGAGPKTAAVNMPPPGGLNIEDCIRQGDQGDAPSGGEEEPELGCTDYKVDPSCCTGDPVGCAKADPTGFCEDYADTYMDFGPEFEQVYKETCM